MFMNIIIITEGQQHITATTVYYYCLLAQPAITQPWPHPAASQLLLTTKSFGAAVLIAILAFLFNTSRIR